ncbi:disks large-associated protein 5 [Ostrinia nubilalis]|uniref:disks large-associated protein 5 n=1 Tax=Ostrinia nubilalis TaxID=29057 RepID=UPI00308227C3
MEKSFDFGRLLKNHEKKHKNKPAQFTSVAGGVQKRLGDNLKHRKSSRLTVFDRIRNLSRCESPTPVGPVDTAKSKVEHRRQQLEKWKEEKEKQKKQAAALKKKPFVAGVPHAPLKFVPPPPPPKPMPSTSGRVTRSQSAKQSATQKANTKQNRAQSFAPINASFQPPKNLIKVPKLAPVTKTKTDKINYTFNPVLPNSLKNPEKQTKSTRSRTQVNSRQANTKSSETRNTRSNAANNKNTRLAKKQSPKKASNSLQSTSSSSEVDTASSTEKSPVFQVKTPRKSLNKSKQFTPTKPVPKSESSSEEKLRSPKSPIDVVVVPMTPEQIDEESKKISPCVTMSRGKDNARREMKKKMEEGLLDDDTSDMESINHFRRQLQSEIKRMTEMCEVWDKIQEQTPLSETIQELVLGAVGQARLLMSQKLQQFASLVERCARPEPAQALVTPADLQGFWDMVFMQVRARGRQAAAVRSAVRAPSRPKRSSHPPTCRASGTWCSCRYEPEDARRPLCAALCAPRAGPSARHTRRPAGLLGHGVHAGTSPRTPGGRCAQRCARPEPAQALVTPADLQGFWDMVFMQVENIDMRFKKLEELRARGWVEDAPVAVVRKAPTKNNVKKATKPSGGPSRLREMIAAARKAKKEQEEATTTLAAPASPAEPSKTFEAGFFCVKSPVRSPAQSTPAKHSLLKAVLSSEAKKASASKNTASFAMLRASIMSKNVEDGIAPLPPSPMSPVNLYATPARSILKSANVASDKKAGKKSIKVVLFDEAETDNDQSRTEDKKEDLEGVSELNTDSGLSSMDVEKETEQKENRAVTKRGRLVRQDATTVDSHQVMTRSRRKSLNAQLDVSNEDAEEKTPRRSSRKKKALQESENIMEDKMATPKRSVRSRKSGIQSVVA